MSLWIHVEFGAIPSVAVPACSGAAREHAAIVGAHVHIGKSRRSTAPLSAATGVLRDKGATRCPCELDVAFSEIASHLQDDGPGAHVFIDPTAPGVPLQLDIALLRSREGCRCAAELLLGGCHPGMVRTAELPELSGDEARVVIRCSSPSRPGAMVRVSANEPRVRPVANPAHVAGV